MNIITKTISRLFIACMFTVAVNGVQAETVSNSSTSQDFTLTEVEVSAPNANLEWNLAYPDNDMPLSIEKIGRKNKVEYIVRSEFFEVRYVNGENGFGVRAVRPSQVKASSEISELIINDTAMMQQKVLVPNRISDEVALGLIASYLPDLLNENYKYIL